VRGDKIWHRVWASNQDFIGIVMTAMMPGGKYFWQTTSFILYDFFAPH
jgi:hypothetical protein